LLRLAISRKPGPSNWATVPDSVTQSAGGSLHEGPKPFSHMASYVLITAFGLAWGDRCRHWTGLPGGIARAAMWTVCLQTIHPFETFRLQGPFWAGQPHLPGLSAQFWGGQYFRDSSDSLSVNQTGLSPVSEPLSERLLVADPSSSGVCGSCDAAAHNERHRGLRHPAHGAGHAAASACGAAALAAHRQFPLHTSKSGWPSTRPGWGRPQAGPGIRSLRRWPVLLHQRRLDSRCCIRFSSENPSGNDGRLTVAGRYLGLPFLEAAAFLLCFSADRYGAAMVRCDQNMASP